MLYSHTHACNNTPSLFFFSDIRCTLPRKLQTTEVGGGESALKTLLLLSFSFHAAIERQVVVVGREREPLNSRKGSLQNERESPLERLLKEKKKKKILLPSILGGSSSPIAASAPMRGIHSSPSLSLSLGAPPSLS